MRVALLTDSDFEQVSRITIALKAVLRHAPPDVTARVYTFASVGVEAQDYCAFRSPGLAIPFYEDLHLYAPRIRLLRARLEGDGVDIVHLTTPGPTAIAARYIARRAGLRLLGSVHTDLAEYTARLSGSARLGAVAERYLRWAYGTCHRVFVSSADAWARLNACGWEADRLAIWPGGVDAFLFSPGRRSRLLRERWRVSDRRPAILYAGRVSAGRGLDMLPSIESLLFGSRVPHRFIVAGDGPMLPELRERLPDAVFLGRLSHKDVATVMASADVFVSPGESDSASSAVLEAQASGLPVLVSAVGGAREDVVDGETGYVCRPGDPRDFSHRLGQLLSSQGQRAIAGERARAQALRHSWCSSLEPLFGAYRSLMTARLESSVGSPNVLSESSAVPALNRAPR